MFSEKGETGTIRKWLATVSVMMIGVTSYDVDSDLAFPIFLISFVALPSIFVMKPRGMMKSQKG